MRSPVARLSCLAIMALVCAAGHAQTIVADLVQDYREGINPGDVLSPPSASELGRWSYLATATTTPFPGTTTPLEWDTAAAAFEAPGRNHADGAVDAYLSGPDAAHPGMLAMHPGQDDLAVVARWTAESELRKVHVDLTAFRFDPVGDGVFVSLIADGLLAYEVQLPQGGSQSISFGADLPDLLVGSTIDLVLRANSLSDLDRTGVTLTLVPTPGPGITCAGAVLVLATRRWR